MLKFEFLLRESITKNIRTYARLILIPFFQKIAITSTENEKDESYPVLTTLAEQILNEVYQEGEMGNDSYEEAKLVAMTFVLKLLNWQKECLAFYFCTDDTFIEELEAEGVESFLIGIQEEDWDNETSKAIAKSFSKLVASDEQLANKIVSELTQLQDIFSPEDVNNWDASSISYANEKFNSYAGYDIKLIPLPLDDFDYWSKIIESVEEEDEEEEEDELEEEELFDNKYRFEEDLGNGGFGKVFLAKEERSENFVAIKQLLNEDKDKQDSIISEMRILSKFNHPNIVIYKHHFIQEDLLYIVMEYCQLGNLREMMYQEKITSDIVWKLMGDLTQTLQFVHGKEIIHHDIKPENILFSENKTVKISDFGVANTGAGTRPYMSPEVLRCEKDVVKDPRVDVYALGIVLLELLTRSNPFFGKSIDEIIELHDRKDFGIIELPNWQQEIILKAIAKLPEQRFQSMKDFNEAIHAKSVPYTFDKGDIQAGNLAAKAGRLLQMKKWQRAYSVLDYAEFTLKPNVNVWLQKGKYHLMARHIKDSKIYYEKALNSNPRLDVQKELGWINLELKNYPTAISMLSDHVHRNPSDYEAYNLLLQCYYETNRYEPAMDLARILLNIEPNNKCFANNYYICSAMHNIGQTIFPDTVLKVDNSENHFLDYNYSVILESDLSHNYEKVPTLKSKLLFMDYRFNRYSPSTLYCTKGNENGFFIKQTQNAIIKFGRQNFEVNDVQVPGGSYISRRHCVIINFKDDVWLYDLASTGTYMNGEKVISKVPIIGRNMIQIGNIEYEFTNDESKLF